MKHLFVINPCAGGKSHVSEIDNALKSMTINAEIYVTTGLGDATRFVEDYCRKHNGEQMRLYACGGDGTLNEVVSAVMNAGQTSEDGIIEVGCFPCGSGNDYVKYWPDGDFHNIKSLTEAHSVNVDVMRVCYRPSANESEGTIVRYALNTLNYGFEAEVCRAMAEVRRKPIIGGRMAYTTGIIKSLATGRHNPCRITVDDKPWQDGDLLLASLANGRYAGGGFLTAPRSVNNDGLLEVTAIKPISIARFASIIKYYKNGEYLDRPELQDIVSYCRAQRVAIESNRQFCIGIDGELLFGWHFKVENIPHALRFIVAI